MQILKNKISKILLKYITIVFSILLLCIIGFIFAIYSGVFGKLPTKANLAAIKNEEASLVISSDSVIIGKYFAENRTNISWNEIPEHLKNALVATEDKRFFTHKGYDLQSYLRVFFKSIVWGDSKGGGGSTLTQQLIKNLYGRKDFGFLSMPVNKTKEIIIAARIEDVYTKDELLLLYLNSVPFGEDVFGIEAAAHRYFNKPARNLKIEESAVLVGLLKANTYFNPRLNPGNSIDRRNMVLNLMENEHYLSASMADSLRRLPLNLNYENINSQAPAGYFVYQVKNQTLQILENIKQKEGRDYNLKTDGLKIYTSLNMQIQKMALEGIQHHLNKMQKLLDNELQRQNFKKRWYNKQKQNFKSVIDYDTRNVELFDWDGIQTKNITKLDSLWHYYKMLNASVLITNPKNGSVICWVGGNNFKRMPFDRVLSHRQIASAFKPILYATALEDNFKPDSYLKNEEKIYTDYNNWKPQNFDHKFTKDSTVALWYALANSMNLPTVDLYFKVGNEKLMNTCNKLHFPYTKNNSPSIALGTLDLSLYEIVRAYTAFANSGKITEPVMINKITDAKGKVLYKREYPKYEDVISEETSQQITAILQKAINEGTGTHIRNQFGIRSDLAGKTGTAQNYSNAWFIAYTPDMVIGTWVGANTPDVHFYSGNGSGSSLALPITANIIQGIENDKLLRMQFLSDFYIPDYITEELECEPYRQTGLKGFFNRLFTPKNKKKK